MNNRLCLSRLSRGGGGRLEKNKKSSTQSTQTVRFNCEKYCFHPKERNQIIICCRAFVSRDFPTLGHDTHNNHEIFHSTFILFLTNIARTKIAQQTQAPLPKKDTTSFSAGRESSPASPLLLLWRKRVGRKMDCVTTSGKEGTFEQRLKTHRNTNRD